MSTLSAHAMLQAWENAQDASPPRRAARASAAAAWPDAPPARWGTLPVGLRDDRLFALQEALFGPELEALVPCPACAESLELAMRTGDLRVARVDDAEPAPPPTLRCEGWSLDWRLPTTDDLLAVVDAGAALADAAVDRLLERCVLAARRDDDPAAVADLPAPVVERLQQEMARHDPGADTQVALNCPACGHAFERRFDIGTYLWDAVDDWATRTLAEVHVLAAAYGWSETQILALSARRRRHYIELVQA